MAMANLVAASTDAASAAEASAQAASMAMANLVAASTVAAFVQEAWEEARAAAIEAGDSDQAFMVAIVASRAALVAVS